jgi:hypothetical protein
MSDWDKGRFKAFEGWYKRQNWKFWECRLSREGDGARRRTWGSGLPVGGSGIGWVHRHVGSEGRERESAESGRGRGDGELRQDAVAEREHDSDWDKRGRCSGERACDNDSRYWIGSGLGNGPRFASGIKIKINITENSHFRREMGL